MIIHTALPIEIANGLKVAGPIFFVGLQLSSVQTATKIFNQKSVGDLSSIPFVSLLTNCIVWTYYGALKPDTTVLVPSAMGILAGAYSTGVYQSIANKTNVGLYAAAIILIASSTFIASEGNYELLGQIGSVLAVLLMGSPLSTLKTVIQDKSTASLPFPTSLATWCNTLSWSLYGLLVADDPLIYTPNLIGFGLACIQMLMFLIYGLPNADSKSKLF